MRWFLPALLGLALLPAVGRAQQPDPAEALAREWAAASTARDHLADAVRALIETRSKERADAESRLKWVLDNWVGKPDAGAQ